MAIPTGVKPFVVQRRMMQLGRVRMGEKGPKGEPRKRDTFRFTSASQSLLESVAEKYGGTVEEWPGAPDDGMWQLATDAAELDIVLPPVFSQADGTPTVPYSQWLELWSAGGCQRRCDGVTEAISGEPCMCDADKRQCQITTRISFLMPDIRGLGVWRLDSHGWNAAAELPGTLEVLHQAAAQGQFIPATLRIEHRTKKSNGQTRRFIVPVVELRHVTVEQLMAGEAPVAINAPAPTPPRPALPAGAPEPRNEAFENGEPEHGEPPPLPSDESNGVVPLTKSEFDTLCEADGITKAEIQKAGKKLFPGKSAGRLTDQERGELRKELIREP